MTRKGARLGRYRLDELLGQGGMAEVWRATDERLNRVVAVKVILATHARDGHFRERFQKEAQLVASLDHPNILPVYDYGDEEGVPYLVMPYLEGGTLRDRMEGAPVPFPLAVAWIRQLGEALDAAHAAGILHRDVKPANVLVRKDDRLALADFGIAKMLETSTGLTATGMVVGTPIYMAPEQAQGRPATPASDRYALAVLAYELLSGRPPFDGESALALMHQHVTAPAPPLSASVHGLPAGLDPLFEKALAKEPEKRPATCRTFADQLLAFVPTGAGLEYERATAPWPAADRTSPTVYEATPKRLAERATPRGAALTSQPTISTAPRPSRRTFRAALAGIGAFVVLAGGLLLSGRLSRPAPEPTASVGAAPVATAAPTSGAPGPGAVRVEELPVPTAAPAPAAPGMEVTSPAPEGRAGAPREDGPFPAQAPPGGAVPPRPVPPPAAGPAPDLRAHQARLDPTLRGGTRPTRDDYDAAARAARAGEQADPGRPGARALELYALGGLAYLDRRDDEAATRLLAAEAVGGKVGPWDLRVLRTAADRLRGGGGATGWELALAFGDARGEAAGLIAADLARSPDDPRVLLGKATLLRLERRPDAAIAEAKRVFDARPPIPLAASAAELIADEEAARGDAEQAASWYRRAAIPMSPSTARAGWEGGRLLEERLQRPDEARELFLASCKAQNARACEHVGERPRPRLFPRRRGP